MRSKSDAFRGLNYICRLDYSEKKTRIVFFADSTYTCRMFRLYIERKSDFSNEAKRIYSEITGFLGINAVKAVRYLNRYDIENVSENICRDAATRIFSEPQSDVCYFTHFPLNKNETAIIWEYLPGQYDQRADSAEQCLSLLAANAGEKDAAPKVRCAKIVLLQGAVSEDERKKIEHYLINPVDSRLASPEIPETLTMNVTKPGDIPVFEGFTEMSAAELSAMREKMGLAMDDADLAFMQKYFKKEGRNPTETEVRVLDTYWSDHCRHTTFNTVLDDIKIEQGGISAPLTASLEEYRAIRDELYGERAKKGAANEKPLTLMDMACIGAKYLKKHGKLDDIELSEEINACSIYIDVDTADYSTGVIEPEHKTERWLLQFKNETHNHPTEIEPFGGAATCIGGAIRDPLSGRAWVYQSLRVTGAADPTVPLSQTREGKLPQMKLTREAAQGFSSYGNQIGLTTGQVAEVYHPGFEAKRMELGAVIAAVPADVVMREEPDAGDCIVLVGGGTGRDGIGGATGSSKAHNVKSVTTAAAEVQKGNAVEERKIQRLFRNRDVSRMIRRCNDFGAGGVSVAVGELAPGLEINLDLVPKKYEGLNGTELAISESQERMAIVVRKKDVEALIAAAKTENLNAVQIATVTDTNRLIMKWRGKTIVDIDRAFLDTAGASRNAKAVIAAVKKEDSPLCRPLDCVEKAFAKGASLNEAWMADMKDLAVCSQRGLSERFDGSIGSSTVTFPMGGRYQSTPENGCAAKIPVLPPFETETSSLMTFGYDPRIASWSPYHGAQVAVLHSLARIAAMGGLPESCRLTFQEYFERTASETAWGKPAAALLGALSAQTAMGTASIGGKDSMSGSFAELKVPPTLVSFAVTTEDARNITSGAFKKAGNSVYFIPCAYTDDLTPNFSSFKETTKALHALTDKKLVSALYPVAAGGIAEAVTKMAFGNKVGLAFDADFFAKLQNAVAVLASKTGGDALKSLFLPLYGSIIAEVQSENCSAFEKALPTSFKLGTTSAEQKITVKDTSISLDEAYKVWEQPLAKVFPPVTAGSDDASKAETLPDFALATHKSLQEARDKASFAVGGKAKPKVLLPVFPGTNCEFDMARAFELAGAETKILVFRNKDEEMLESSLNELQKELASAQILALSGGFSAGDEPDGSGKFIANVLRENRIAQAVTSLIDDRDGLVLGICNGFQALIKTGLVPYGKILAPSEEMPTLTYNRIGRHISRVVRTRMVSALSPWAQHQSVVQSQTHLIPISHGEGRVIIDKSFAKELFEKGQIFTQYVDETGKPVMTEPDNPNGSMFAIEGMTSPDGRVLGKMGHNERTIGTAHLGSSDELIKNIEGNKCQNIFAAGVRYFG